MKMSRKGSRFPVKMALLLPVLMLAGCSENGGGNPETPVLKYASVEEGNANMPCSGIIMAEFGDAPSGSDISKLVDNDPNTSYLTYHSGFDITFTGNSGSDVIEYSIVASGGAFANTPRSWVLYGSNDDKNWTKIDSRSKVSFEDGVKKTYALEAVETYKSYRLEITENNGGDATSIAEWVLSAEEVTEIRVPIYEMPELASVIHLSDKNGWSYSDETTMGKHYAGLHVTTDEDREWLANPDTDIEIPVSAAGLNEGSASWSTPTFVLYPAGDPRPADINQHGIGDCCLCAALAEMAYIYPDFIKSIIKKNGDAYDIAMFDPQGKPVTVCVTTSCLMDSNNNIVAVSGKDNTATWSTLLEKAIMKWNVIYKKSPSLGGIGTEIVPCLFTGNGGSIAFGAGALTAQQLKDVVDALLENGVLVIGGFNQSDLKISDIGYTTVSGHAYSFFWTPNNEALFYMRNPWGGAANAPEGDKCDGAMDIFDDGIIPPTIDLRVCEPGIAAPYMENPLMPYQIPQYSPNNFLITPAMLRNCGLQGDTL